VTGLIYINSIIAAEQSFSKDGSISPIHYWGYVPDSKDKFYGTSQKRFDIILRSYISGGLDYGLLTKVFFDLIAGYDSIYLITMPDLLKTIPFIKRFFPNSRIVTWAWIADEVIENHCAYELCDHIFCLTEPALNKFQEMGLGSRASLQIWGVDPSYYNYSFSSIQSEFDICLLGRVGRDMQIVTEVIQKYPFKIATTELVGNFVDISHLRGTVSVINARTHQQVVELIHKSRIAWIPLPAGNPHPTGYTNLIESLLSGTAVVIADSSTIPSSVLSLPGVYLYKTGCIESLIEKTNKALEDSQKDGFRQCIQKTASQVLNGVKLAESIARLCHSR
jgi:hypothetical protein